MKIIRLVPNMLKLALFDENPVFLRFAFLCPALVASASLWAGLWMGLAVLFALVCTGVCSALLRPIVHEKLRFVCAAILSAFFATAADLLFQAYCPGFSAAMGIFVPLLAVGCFTLCLHGFGDENALLCGLRGMCMGLGAVIALCAAGALRELLASGTVAGIRLFALNNRVLFFDSPAGAFIGLGLAAGFMRLLSQVAGLKKPGTAAVLAYDPSTVQESPEDGGEAE